MTKQYTREYLSVGRGMASLDINAAIRTACWHLQCHVIMLAELCNKDCMDVVSGRQISRRGSVRTEC